jgi:cytochrome P450
MFTETTVDTSDPATSIQALVDAQRHGPTARDVHTGTLIVLGYRDVDRLAHDRRMAGVGLTWFDLMGVGGQLRDWYGELMFTNEGEPHMRMRRLVSRAFTPRSIERLRSFTRAIVEGEVNEIETGGRGDLAASFARLGTRVMCRLLGVPEDDVGVFAGWNDALSRVFGFMDAEQIHDAAGALEALTAYTSELVERRYRQPSDDLMTALLQAEHEGDRLTRHEVVTMVSNLLVAAHDTTASQLVCSLLTLLRHPGELERARANAVAAADVLTETMRFEPAIPLFPRTATAPIEIAGVERPAGTMVLLSVGSANRDADVYGDPERFDVARFSDPDVPGPLSFGSGPHFCLGANLAKMAMEETITAVAASRLRLDDLQRVEWRSVLGRSPVKVPVLSRPIVQ